MFSRYTQISKEITFSSCKSHTKRKTLLGKKNKKRRPTETSSCRGVTSRYNVKRTQTPGLGLGLVKFPVFSPPGWGRRRTSRRDQKNETWGGSMESIPGGGSGNSSEPTKFPPEKKTRHTQPKEKEMGVCAALPSKETRLQENKKKRNHVRLETLHTMKNQNPISVGKASGGGGERNSIPRATR